MQSGDEKIEYLLFFFVVVIGYLSFFFSFANFYLSIYMKFHVGICCRCAL